MVEAPKPPNGNGHTTIVQAAIKLGGQVTQSLGPQFLALIIVNAMFLAALFWFVDARARHSVDVIQHLLQACLTKQ